MPIDEDGPWSGETTKSSDELYRVGQVKERQMKAGGESEKRTSAFGSEKDRAMGQSLLQGSRLVDSAVGKCTHSLVWTHYSQVVSSSAEECVVPGVCRQQVTQGQLGLGHLKFILGLLK